MLATIKKFFLDLDYFSQRKNIKYLKLLGNSVKVEFSDPIKIKVEKIMTNLKGHDLKLMKENKIQFSLENGSFKSKCIEISSIIDTIS